MKTCMIWGDMSSDRASEQYPSVTVCDDCVARADIRISYDPETGFIGKSVKNQEKSITVSEYDPSLGDTCEFCGKTAEEEAEE